MAAVGASKQSLSEEAPTEPQRVWAWRLEQFVRLGVDDGDTAGALADSRVDVREFERMVRSGCEPMLAASILL